MASGIINRNLRRGLTRTPCGEVPGEQSANALRTLAVASRCFPRSHPKRTFCEHCERFHERFANASIWTRIGILHPDHALQMGLHALERDTSHRNEMSNGLLVLLYYLQATRSTFLEGPRCEAMHLGTLSWCPERLMYCGVWVG